MSKNIVGISFENGMIHILDGEGIMRDVTLADFLQEIIDTVNLVDEAVTGVKIAGDAISGDHIQDEAIDSEHYTPRSILAKHLSEGVAFALYQKWTEFGELKELRANEEHGYANVEQR